MSKRLVIEDVLRTIRELTEHLKTIREEISGVAFQQESPLAGNILLEAGNGAETITQFRAVIDDLRHTLWLYVETAQGRKTNNPEVQRKLLARATETLCALSLHSPIPRTYVDPTEGSFVERLLQFMEISAQPAAIQKELEAKPELSRAANGCS